MPFYSGQNGELQIDGTRAAKVQNWQWTANQTTLETTTLGDRDRTSIEGIRNISGTCSLYYYAADPNNTSTNSASVLLNKLIKQAAGTTDQGAASEQVRLKFIINDGTSTKKYIEGDCILTSTTMQMAVGDVLSAQVAFEFVGAPTSILL